VTRPRGRRVARGAVAAACLLVLAACGPGWSPIDPAYGGAFVTTEGTDVYGMTVSNGLVTVYAPTSNTGSNTRALFWQAATADSADQETCATWRDNTGDSRQQGAALRVRSTPDRTTAITVTNNILYGARWGFNIHVMDTAAATPIYKIGGVILEEVFRPGGSTSNDVEPLPWRMCARVVGSVVSFIVWPLSHPEPAWDDPRYGTSVTLPAGWDAPGRPGWYIGHLSPGESVGYDLLTTAVIGTTAQAGVSSTSASGGVVGPEPTLPPRAPTWVPDAP
jgi:hypothetical protein